MDRRPTSRDVAALAGVSQPTVSRALRGDPTVAKVTRERVQEIARSLNYTVDTRASALRDGASRTLAVLFFEDPLPNGSGINPFFLAMIGPMLRAAKASGYDLLCSFQHHSSDWHVDFTGSRRADGLILLGYGDFSAHSVRAAALAESGTRFVRWGACANVEETRALGVAVGCDNHLAGCSVAEHLLARGRTRFAFIGNASAAHPEFRQRFAGFAEAIAAAGRGFPSPLHVDAEVIEEAGKEATEHLLGSAQQVDAIFAGCDMIAVGVLRALTAAGRRVPEDVALVGFDDIPAASLCTPPLTTVSQNASRAGEVLVGTLLAQIAGKPAMDQLLEPELVVRAST